MATTLQVKTREKSSSSAVERTRKAGSVPMALLTKDQGTRLIEAPRAELKSLMNDIAGVKIFPIEIPGESAKTVILKDVQRDPVSRQVIHLTVMEVTDEDTVRVSIPIVFEGTPKAVTKRVATLMTPMNQVEILAKVKAIPDQMNVSVAKMKQNDRIVVGDLAFPEGVSPISSPAAVVAATKQLRGMADFIDDETPAETETDPAAEPAAEPQA